jgi:hypothetical protein
VKFFSGSVKNFSVSVNLGFIHSEIIGNTFLPLDNSTTGNYNYTKHLTGGYAMLEIEHLNEFVEKCKRMIKAYPDEAQYLANAIYHLVYLSFFAGYIRGKDPDFDYNKVLSWVFGGFSTDEWKEVEGEVIYTDEDYFRCLNSEAFQLAENLYPIVKRLMGQEPIKGPIGTVRFIVGDEE